MSSTGASVEIRMHPRRKAHPRGAWIAGAVVLLAAISALAAVSREATSAAPAVSHRAKPFPSPPQAPGAKPTAGKADTGRPNILVVMSDDQTQDSQRFMPAVNSLVGARGAVFRNSFVSNPLCCPSRATFLTGQYSRNNHVQTNTPPLGGYESLDNTNTLPVWLQDSGYYTSLIGKYLNGYDNQPQPQTIPPGWTNWQGTTRTYRYYDWQMNENGTLVNYGTEPSDYQTDVFTRKALNLISDRAGKSKPWFMWLTYLAPHDGAPNPNPQPPANCSGTAKPAPRDAGAYDSEPLPMPPNFNESDLSDKPSFRADDPLLTQTDIDTITRYYHCRLASLNAVDDGVASIIDELKRTGQLKNTYVIYTSDNGFFAGEHRIPMGKRKPYEPALRVPLQIRGPGIKPGTDVRELVVNADLAPTIAKLAHAKPRLKIDGRPLQSIWDNPRIQRGRELLLSGTQKRFSGMRNRRYLFINYVNHERELYDLQGDSQELANVYDNPAYAAAQAAVEKEFERLRLCAGERCEHGTGVELRVIRKQGTKKPCARRPTAVRAERPGGEIETVLFKRNGGSAIADADPPFEVRIPDGSPTKVRVDARVDLLDGRRVTRSLTPAVCD
jgi:N-acetylglucosamine-6-sulfatase